MGKNFAIIGCAGYVAPRHIKAMKETGNNLVMALDKSDSVGILDRYFNDVHFFTEFESFDRHADKLRRRGEGEKIDYVSICSPNYLHEAHARFALRIGAHAICEKPLVLAPWNIDGLEVLEKETGKKVYAVLQLRLHPTLIELKKKISAEIAAGRSEKYDVDLSYVTSRGPWYHYSWKGNEELSGGLATNIGVHFFDMLSWIFGPVQKCTLHHSDKKKVAGCLELEHARVRWFLSVDRSDLSLIKEVKEGASAYRSITVNGKEVEFSNVFADLHTEVYKDILAGRGFGIAEAKPSIDLVHKIRSIIPAQEGEEKMHALTKSLLARQ